MSIVRMGLAENKKVGEGWEAVFGKKKSSAAKPTGGKSAKGKKKGKR
jgi:hypothetical protein